MKTQYKRILFVAIGLMAAFVAQAAGVDFFQPEVLAGLGMVPMLMGDTAMEGLTELLTKQGKAFEEFKSANDARLKAIEAKGYAPADLEAKVGTINDDLSKLSKEIAEIAKKSNRRQAGSAEESEEMSEYKSAFGSFLRKGDDNGLAGLERKAMGRGSDINGGYLVQPELAAEIDRIAATTAAVRGLADVRGIGSASLKFRVKTRGVGASWPGAEGATNGESTPPQHAQLEIKAETLEAEPWVFNDTLEDADYNLEMDLADEAGIAFGEAEGVAFVSGDGVGLPRGFLSYTNVANSSYAWGKVGFVASGKSAGFADTNPADKVLDLIHSLKNAYRNGAVMLMADTTLAELRKLKDGSGNFYLFNPDPTGEFAGLILGKSVVIDDNMPTIAANSYSIAYANWKRAYRIVDRSGISLIRDSITAKGTTKFNFRRRVGGGIKQFEAIKLMKFAA